MKVFFVNPPFKPQHGKFSRESRSPAIGRSGVLYYPLWLVYAAAVVEREGFDVKFLDAPATRMDVSSSLDYIEQEGKNAGLFVLDTSTPSIYNDICFGEQLKDRFPNAFVLLVGTHPSALPAETLQMSNKIDGVARREFDYIVRDLAYALRQGDDLQRVNGLSYRDGQTIRHNPDASYIQDLDDLPFAASFIKSHLDIRNYFFAAATYPSIQFFTGRGCPAKCNFCVYPQTLHGHKYRARSPQNIVEELLYIAENFPDVKEIVIEDDTFTIDKNRVVEICDLLLERNLHKRFRWLCNARVSLDYETMIKMKKAGCRLVIPGIESVNQDILDNINKGTTIMQIESFMSNTRKAGLLVHACYMVGNMGETRGTMEETLKAALRYKTDTAQFYPLIPYPGTGAYKWAKSCHYLTAGYRDFCKEDGTLNCVINLPTLSSSDLVDFCAYARKKYYLRGWYILHRVWMGMRDFNDLKRSLRAFINFRKYVFRGK